MIFRDNVRKTCGFYVSEYHLVTMLLPHIVTKIEKGEKIDAILKKEVKKEMKELVSKLNINDITRAKILNINWGEAGDINFNYIKNYMEGLIKNNKNIEIIVNGTKEEIDDININIEYWIDMNIEKMEGIHINIINCYEVSEFNSNINAILGEHDYIVNTSGEYPVGEAFKEYRKKAI